MLDRNKVIWPHTQLGLLTAEHQALTDPDKWLPVKDVGDYGFQIMCPNGEQALSQCRTRWPALGHFDQRCNIVFFKHKASSYDYEMLDISGQRVHLSCVTEISFWWQFVLHIFEFMWNLSQCGPVSPIFDWTIELYLVMFLNMIWILYYIILNNK